VSNAAVVQAIARGRVDGEELSFGGLPTTGIVTANVSFFPKTLTLFASRRAFDRLNDRQRRLLRAAARETVTRASSFPERRAVAFESTLTGEFCHSRGPVGHVALASGRDIAGLEQATRPVTLVLERDARTRELIAGIRRLAIGLPPSPPLVVPRGCLVPTSSPALHGTSVPASALDGTYRWRLTESGAKAFGPPAYEPGNVYPELHSVVLQDGTWRSPDGGGTYRIVGDRIEFHWRDQGYTLTFTFVRDADGTLRLKPVLPMDRGDQWVFAGVPWRRVGPPS
jgi:hypothetical protein